MFLHRMGLPGAQRGRSLSKMPRLTQLDSPSKQPVRAARQAHTHVSISLGSADRPLATNSKTWVMNVEPPLGSGFPVRGGGAVAVLSFGTFGFVLFCCNMGSSPSCGLPCL